MLVCITLPAYNEEKTIGPVLDDIRAVMIKQPYRWKLVVVNDGSTDNTAAVAKEHGALVYSHPRNMGLAEAFKTEIAKCLELGATIFVHTDADGQYVAQEIPGLVAMVQKGYDLVLGSRFRGHIESMPFLKRLGNKAFSRVLSRITKQRITDGQTGFRAFNREVAQLPITSTFTYTQEQIIRVAKAKMRIVEVPATFRIRGKKTKSRLMKGPFDYAVKAGINLLRVYRDYEPLKFFGGVGFVFIFISFLIGIHILDTYLLFGAGKLDRMLPTIILAVTFFLTGIQIAMFGFLADSLRK